jgi:hypothetical protein
MSNKWKAIGYCSRCTKPVFAQFEYLRPFEWSIGLGCDCSNNVFKKGNPANSPIFSFVKYFIIAFFTGLSYFTNNPEFSVAAGLTSFMGWIVYLQYKQGVWDRQIFEIMSFNSSNQVTIELETIYGGLKFDERIEYYENIP